MSDQKSRETKGEKSSCTMDNEDERRVKPTIQLEQKGSQPEQNPRQN